MNRTATGLLLRYIEMEKEMMRLDDAGDVNADQLRDEMDGLWRELSDADHAWLNARGEMHQ